MQRELEFSFFMMRRTTRRWGANSMLYAAELWAVVSGGIAVQVPAGDDREAALSFVRQAREYFVAAERASTIETRPLLTTTRSSISVKRSRSRGGGEGWSAKSATDITRTGEWSPDCTSCWWDDEFGAGQVGAWFTGRNELPNRTWETRSGLVAAERGREFA